MVYIFPASANMVYIFPARSTDETFKNMLYAGVKFVASYLV